MIKPKSELDKIVKLLTDGHNGMESLAMLSYIASLVFIFRISDECRDEILASWVNNVKDSVAMGREIRAGKQ